MRSPAKRKANQRRRKRNLRNRDILGHFWDPAYRLVFGKLVKTHGYRGSLKLHYTDNYIPEMNKGDWLLVLLRDKPVPFFIEDIRSAGEDISMVSLRDVDSVEKAQGLVGQDVCLVRKEDDIVGQAELQPSELEGYTIFDAGNIEIGMVIQVMEAPEQHLLEVETQDRRVLIPLHADWIIEFNGEEKILRMELPDGLLDL